MKLVEGVGVNDADYVTEVKRTVSYINKIQKCKIEWSCPFYNTWKSMLHRCYSENYKRKRPTYRESFVCEEWLLFSNFKAWMETQDWEGKQLDKDLLVPNNKMYSPDTCVFVSAAVNSFITERRKSASGLLVGVYQQKGSNKFIAFCRNNFTNKNEYLGTFASEHEAHKVWLKRKLELAYGLAVIQTNELVSQALIYRYENYDKF